MAHDEFVGVGVLESLDDFIVSGVRLSIFHIFFDGSVEKDRFLSHIPNLLSVVLQVDIFQISSINEHLTFLRVIESFQQLDDGALS